MQSFSAEDMGADQIGDRVQGDGAGPDLVGQRGKADLDALLRVAFGLPVQGLMLAASPWSLGPVAFPWLDLE